MVEILSRVDMKVGGKSHDDFQFGTFIDHFPTEGAASMAVEGLIIKCKKKTKKRRMRQGAESMRILKHMGELSG